MFQIPVDGQHRPACFQIIAPFLADILGGRLDLLCVLFAGFWTPWEFFSVGTLLSLVSHFIGKLNLLILCLCLHVT